MRTSVFLGHERLTDRSISKRYPKSDIATRIEKFQPQECFTLMTQDSVGHLKTLCMSILSPAVAFEPEWIRYTSLHSVEKKR